MPRRTHRAQTKSRKYLRKLAARLGPEPEPTPDQLAGSLVQRGLAPTTILSAGRKADDNPKGTAQ